MERVAKLIISILLFPIYLVFGILFFVLWLVSTITGVGPLLQYCFKSCDSATLDDAKDVNKKTDLVFITVPPNINSASGTESYKLAARYSVPANCNLAFPPVVLPNGLGATLVLTSTWHEEILRRGYRVLSFDRLGVGFSDDNPTGKHPTAPDLIREMDYVMNSFMPKDTKWVIVGGSMGCAVGQCYISAFPHKVLGLLDMDGMPYPFIVAKKGFEFAANLYKIYTYIIWTGIFRPFIGISLKSMEAKLSSKAFPAAVIRAQLNQTRFFANIAIEMLTMMDLCEFATVAWGNLDINKLREEDLDVLVRAPADASVHVDVATDVRSLCPERSVSERGADWSSEEAVDQVIKKLHSLDEQQGLELGDVDVEQGLGSEIVSVPDRIISRPNLPRVWKSLVVRVMSARCHDFGNEQMNKFYTQQMRDLAAAEHTLHARLAKNGKRTVYPKQTHNRMFLMTGEIMDQLDEIMTQLSH